MKQSVLIMSVLVICVSCAGAPSSAPLQYHIKISEIVGPQDNLILEEIQFVNKDSSFPQGAVFLGIRNNTDKEFILDTVTCEFIQNGNQSPHLVGLSTKYNRTSPRYIRLKNRIDRYFFPADGNVLVEGDKFSLLLKYFEIEERIEIRDDIDQNPFDDWFTHETAITGEFSFKIDFTRIEQ
jgi:hypothetical protein